MASGWRGFEGTKSGSDLGTINLGWAEDLLLLNFCLGSVGEECADDFFSGLAVSHGLKMLSVSLVMIVFDADIAGGYDIARCTVWQP